MMHGRYIFNKTVCFFVFSKMNGQFITNESRGPPFLTPKWSRDGGLKKLAKIAGISETLRKLCLSTKFPHQEIR